MEQKTKEAYLNECKGVLLEFMTAKKFSEYFGIEIHLSSQFSDKLNLYQDLLMSEDLNTFLEIQKISKKSFLIGFLKVMILKKGKSLGNYPR